VQLMKLLMLRPFELLTKFMPCSCSHAPQKANVFMRFNLLIGIAIFAFSGLSFAVPISVLIRTAYDGDTVILNSGEQVRYLGIDAPEMGRKGAKSDFMALESRNYNLQLVRDVRVRLEFDEERKDRHGRILAYVFLENGDMVNLLLVRKGLAFVSTKKPNMKYLTLLLDAQRQAMIEKLGIWSRPPEKTEPFYRGNRNSHRFHRPNCLLGRKIGSRNLIRFDTREGACWEGYSPCRQCKP
jgi:micrococcal nuclease